MPKSAVEREQKKPLVRRFWRTARGFWSSARSWKVAWLMTACLICLVVGQLFGRRLERVVRRRGRTGRRLRQLGLRQCRRRPVRPRRKQRLTDADSIS